MMTKIKNTVQKKTKKCEHDSCQNNVEYEDDDLCAWCRSEDISLHISSHHFEIYYMSYLIEYRTNVLSDYHDDY